MGWPAEVWSGTAGYFFTVVGLIGATYIAKCMKMIKPENAGWEISRYKARTRTQIYTLLISCGHEALRGPRVDADRFGASTCARHIASMCARYLKQPRAHRAGAFLSGDAYRYTFVLPFAYFGNLACSVFAELPTCSSLPAASAPGCCGEHQGALGGCFC